MTEKERMLAGLLYCAADPGLAGERRRAAQLLGEFNDPSCSSERRSALLAELLGGAGPGAAVEPPFRCDYGRNIFVGANFFANYDCIILDVCPVNIGSNVMLGPRVCIFTAAHPLDPETRAAMLEYGRPVTIGDDVWIGGGAVINPGVSIGRGSVIGSGSVVTHDIPAGVIAAGNPCRVLRPISDKDRGGPGLPASG